MAVSWRHAEALAAANPAALTQTTKTTSAPTSTNAGTSTNNELIINKKHKHRAHAGHHQR
jgi:hypothetical protein